MPPPFNPYPLHSTKEIRGHPAFQGAISRWLWRLYTHRLTTPGLWFLGMTVAFAMYGATSLDLQVFVPFTYALGIWLMALLFAQARPPRVTLAARHAARIEAGQTLTVAIELQTAGRAIFDAVILPRRLPPAIDADPPEGISLGTLRPGEIQHIRLGLRCSRRGLYVLRGYRVQSEFPFGLLRAYTSVETEQTLLVTPQFTPLTEMTLPLRRSTQPGGAALSTTRGESLEFIGDREFRDGDSIRDIDWRATARLDRLVVREFREEYFHRVALVLDTQVSPARVFENLVSLCAAASDYLARQEYALDLLAVGRDFYDLAGGQNLAVRDRVLDLLATASESRGFETPPDLTERLEHVSVAVCILGDWDQTRRGLVMEIERTGAAAHIVIVRDLPCTVDPATESARFGGITVMTSAQAENGPKRL